MRRCSPALVAWLLLATPAVAEIGTIDDVPAATLLLPYFEVDVDDYEGINTLFSINNASASAAVAHVTVWTDQSIPTLDFDVYLTGFDVQTISIRDIFRGDLPRTADDLADPADTISNEGALSQDINFPGSSGPCAAAYTNPVLDSFRRTQLRLAHTGLNASAYGGCLGANHGDDRVRGYITVDIVTECNLFFPSSPNYFASGVAGTANILWGDYFYVEPREAFAQGEGLVAIESCPSASSTCSFAPGAYTFYGRYATIAGQDQREPLATSFAVRYFSGAEFDAGTELVVWRDSKTTPSGLNGPYTCGSTTRPAWFPMSQASVIAFDEQENPEELCFQGDIISPPIGGTQTCFPLETQRVEVEGGHPIASDLAPSQPSGWLWLGLSHTLAPSAGADPFPGVAQAWVVAIASAEGRYSMGYDAIKLDSAGDLLVP